MDSGLDFLKSQIDNAAMQHQTFLRSLEDHESQAEDLRFRDLCTKHIPRVREHQRMLESLRAEIDGASRSNESVADSVAGAMKKAVGGALGVAKDLADAPRQSDFLRLVEDIVMARQAEDTFKTFREAGRALAIEALARVGEIGERHHDDYVKEANRLAQQMFVEHARGAEHSLRTTVDTRTGIRP